MSAGEKNLEKKKEGFENCRLHFKQS